MTALTHEEYLGRELAIEALRKEQPIANLVAAGCCPSACLSFSSESPVEVYCERHVGSDGRHDDRHPVGMFCVGHCVPPGAGAFPAPSWSGFQWYDPARAGEGPTGRAGADGR